jgi:predicted TIM-barrel fold metal-dependent hydrolase
MRRTAAALALAVAAPILAGACWCPKRPAESASVSERSTAAVESSPRPVPIDHHVHLIGPDLLRDWKSLGVPFSRRDEVYLSAAGLIGPGTDAPPAVDGVALISMAHMYGRSGFRAEMGLPVEEERARVARENDHVAREAARTPARAVAFCSVAILRPYAEAELDRCHAELGARGVKIHLAASDVDLTDADHLDTLGRILGRAEERGQAVLLHVDPQRRGLVASDIARLARTVLEPRRELTLVVAHLGGSGGYGAWTRQVFATLVDWLEERRAAGDPRPGVYFDTSAVILEEESEGVPPTTPEEAAALAADLRRAGLDRIVLGSDYPVFDPRRTLELLGERAGLTAEEVAAIAANRAIAIP